MFTKCPARNNSTVAKNDSLEDQAWEMTQSKCERPNLSKLEEALPVSDTRSNLTYRNIHCARCSNINENNTYTWSTNITCSESPVVLSKSILSKSKAQLFEMLLNHTEVERTGCQMIYAPTQREYRRGCHADEERVISTCNVTGQWIEPWIDPDIEMACHMYTSQVKHWNGAYKNLFCFLCNYPMSLSELQVNFPVPTANPARVGFSVLMDFTSNDIEDGEYVQGVQEPENCSSTQFFDNVTCSCRDIHCSKLTGIYQEGNTCRMNMLNMLLKMCLKLHVHFYDVPSLMRMTFLMEQFPFVVPFYNNIMTITVSNWCPGSSSVTIFLEIEEYTEKSNSSFGEMAYKEGDMFCEYLRRTDSMGGNIDSCTFRDVNDCPLHTKYHDICNPVLPPSIQYTVFPRSDDFYYDFIDATHLEGISYTLVRRHQLCPVVEIPISDFDEAHDNQLIHRLSGKMISISLTTMVYFKNIIRLCLNDYIQWSQNDELQCKRYSAFPSSLSHDTWRTSGLISIITSCVSLVFLFLTLLTYMLFAEARTGGYKNIIVLTINLIIAQAIHEFGIEQYENKTVCSIIGILIHFFWLASIFSMNTCTVERFVMLCFPFQSRSFFMSPKSFMIALANTFLGPSIIIVCNVIVNVVKRDDLGYGSSRSKICFINSKYNHIFSFLLPIFAIVVLNTALSVTTVVKLRRGTFTGDKKKYNGSKIGLIACARLSVITGFTWLNTLLNEAIPVDVLEYIFTALFGLHGVILFFSLLGRMRVLELYSALLRSKNANGNNISSGRLNYSESKGNKSKMTKRELFRTRDISSTIVESHTQNTMYVGNDQTVDRFQLNHDDDK